MSGQFTKFASAQDNFDLPGVEDIDPNELAEKLDAAKIALIDVRQPGEFTGELGHIKGAELIVLDTLAERLDEIPTDKTVVFICKSGGRSGRATAFARENGFDNTYNLKGGMTMWNQLGLEVEGRNEN